MTNMKMIARHIVGILKLDGTDRAVTAEQALEFLPLWEVTKVLAANDTSAQVEIDATVREIKETLTPDQLQAIANTKRDYPARRMACESTGNARGQCLKFRPFFILQMAKHIELILFV